MLIPIKPDKLNISPLIKELEEALKETGNSIHNQFAQTITTFDEKPEFKMKFESGKTEISSEVSTDDNIYAMLNFGTKPHIITPKRGRFLVFNRDYLSKTIPGVLRARRGGRSGQLVFARIVRHPGTEARRFDEKVAEKERSPFRGRLEKAMAKGWAKTGHILED